MPVRHKFASRGGGTTLLLASIEAGVGSGGVCAVGWKEAKPGVIYPQITAGLPSAERRGAKARTAVYIEIREVEGGGLGRG